MGTSKGLILATFGDWLSGAAGGINLRDHPYRKRRNVGSMVLSVVMCGIWLAVIGAMGN